MATELKIPDGDEENQQHPFRKAVLRGLAVVLPPLLTVVIFMWVINMTFSYVLNPVMSGVRWVLVETTADVRTDLDPSKKVVTLDDGETYRRIDGQTFIPQDVYERVQRDPGEPRPETAEGFYYRYVDLTWLRPQYAIPFFLAILILLLYLLGKFMAAGIGNFFWHRFEYGIHRLPLIRNVYSSVKQISDFLFTETEIEYTRVVALEYPRKGIWSLGLVTGESMLDIRSAANEPILSVLIPTSPMPVTGYTVTIRKSEALDLNITIDQAFQFIVSCGVVIPPQQLQEALEAAEALPESSEA